MSIVKYDTVADKVLYSTRMSWHKHISGNPVRPITEEAYVESWLNNMTRKQFLQEISDAVAEYVEDKLREKL